MQMVHTKQLDKMIRYITLFICIIIVIIACKNKKTKESVNLTNTSVQKLNNQGICFNKRDSLAVVKILNQLKTDYKNNEEVYNLLTDNYLEVFKEFPSKLFSKALKNNAKPDFNINCDILTVYYNYTVRVVDDGEEYFSESSLMFYFIKNNKGEILLDGFGAAG